MDISHRKVSKKIRFLDASGAPIANKNVKVTQTNHKFLFGCGAFEFLPYVMSQDENMDVPGGGPFASREQL